MDQERLRNFLPTTSLDFDLLHLGKIAQTLGEYNYLEVGVYRGGSLPPHLVNPDCKLIMGVDLFPDLCMDERHTGINYRPSSFELVVERTTAAGGDASKLKSFVGDIQDLPVEERYDMCFIDAEHTNAAAFRDAYNALKHMKPNHVMAFHDTTIVYGAIDCWTEYLKLQGISFHRFKMRHSEVTAFVCGDLPETLKYCFENQFDYDTFKMVAKVRLGNSIKENCPNYTEYMRYAHT